MANQYRGLVFTGGAKTDKGLAQHLHTARSPSDRLGQYQCSSGITGGGRMDTAAYTVHTKYTLHIY